MSVFPDTRLSVVAGLSSDDPGTRSRAMEIVARAYRAPIIAVLQHRWSLDTPDAEDLAHDFFVHAFSKEWLQRFDASRGRFRTFLRSCLSAYASTAHEAAHRLKRGGGSLHLSLDDDNVAATSPEVDAIFDREWVRSVLTLSLESFRRECEGDDTEDEKREGRAVTYAVFVARDVDGADLEVPPSYSELAERFAVLPTQVTNYLNWARRRFRVHVLETLRALTASDDEFRAEARALLGVEVS
ncbi:MAG: hypothetical protein ABI877_18495 [Gemmatimonadaceae bacterium]